MLALSDSNHVSKIRNFFPKLLIFEAGIEVTAKIGGVAMSMILSAISASLERSIGGSAEVRTIHTFTGRRGRKSSLRNASSGVGKWLPRSCCTSGGEAFCLLALLPEQLLELALLEGGSSFDEFSLECVIRVAFRVSGE